MNKRNTKRGTRCAVCGLRHAALNLEIADGVLLRTAREHDHLIRNFGGAWGFTSKLFDAHKEIRRVQILATDTGRVFHADIDTITRRAFRRLLDVRAGEQIIMPLRDWKILDTRSGPHDGAALADESPAMETAQALEMSKRLDIPHARPVFGDREWLRKAKARRA